VGLATLATIIASQAVISGSFSLTRQAVQLGFSPRLLIRHTSREEIGQIYVPAVNWILMVATIALVLGFQTSDNLASAYGVAVTTTMVITTVLFYMLARRRWHWHVWTAAPLALAFIIVDLAFFSANIIKVEHGGWFPLLVAAVIFMVMATWKRGRQILADRLQAEALDVNLFMADIARRQPLRVEGTAVYMTASASGVPGALLHNLKHNHVLHERVVFLTVLTEEVPQVPPAERLTVEELGEGFFRITARYGFMTTPDVQDILLLAARQGLGFDLMQTTFVLGRETLIPSGKSGMSRWREVLFTWISQNAQRPTAFFNIPPNRVVELGAQIEL
jgi:KUP system potassium uptake protein